MGFYFVYINRGYGIAGVLSFDLTDLTKIKIVGLLSAQIQTIRVIALTNSASTVDSSANEVKFCKAKSTLLGSSGTFEKC